MDPGPTDATPYLIVVSHRISQNGKLRRDSYKIVTPFFFRIQEGEEEG